MDHPNTPATARLMAAGMVIDRGWGKAAQLIEVQGEIKQLVAVQLNVVHRDVASVLPSERR